MKTADKRLIALPSILALMDVAVTLAGQPSGYWQGMRSLATDANPLVEQALQITPLLAIPASLAWIAMIWTIMSYLPPKWRRASYIFLCLSHLTFVWTWIYQWAPLAGFLFLGVALLVVQLMHRQLQITPPASS